MRTVQTVLAGLLGGALLLGPSGLVQADNATSNNLEDRVEKSLDNVDAFRGLEVDVDAGVVTLKGEVATAAEKARAEKLARTAGAKKVVNQLEIDADKAVARIKDRAQVRKDKIDEQAAADKESVDRRTEAAAARVESGRSATTSAEGKTTAPRKEVFDPLVTAKVKTKIIKDDLLDQSDINVDTDTDGMVTLKGTVASDAAKTRALELARTTEGVRRVVDRLEVKAPVIK